MVMDINNKDIIDLLHQQGFYDREIFVLVNIKLFSFLRTNYDISSISYAAWETSILYHSPNNGRGTKFLWDSQASELFVFFGELNKKQRLVSQIMITDYPPCKDLPKKATIYEIEDVLKEYVKYFHQYLSPVIRGEIWIDKLIKQNA